MALMERVATLIRANLNDLIDQAEDPEKMLKQVMLDMQNQLMQVKTQVAIAIADQHVLAKKKAEQEAQGGGVGPQSGTGGKQGGGRPGARRARALANLPRRRGKLPPAGRATSRPGGEL